MLMYFLGRGYWNADNCCHGGGGCQKWLKKGWRTLWIVPYVIHVLSYLKHFLNFSWCLHIRTYIYTQYGFIRKMRFFQYTGIAYSFLKFSKQQQFLPFLSCISQEHFKGFWFVVLVLILVCPSFKICTISCHIHNSVSVCNLKLPKNS